MAVVRKMRMEGLYKDDREKALRCSHQNPQITKIYNDFLGSPCSEKAHHLLHTHYTAKPVYAK